MKILLATDGSTHAQAAVQMAQALPFPREEAITVLSVAYVEKPYMMDAHPRWLVDVRGLYEEAKEDEMKAAQHRVEVAAEQLRSGGWQVKEIVRFGHPAEQVLEVVVEVGADLLIVGSRGLSTFKGWLLGSVSQALVHAAPCSVLIVRAAPDEATPKSLRILFATDGSEDAAAAIGALQKFRFNEPGDLAVLTVTLGRVPITHEDIEAARKLVSDTAEQLHSSFGKVITMRREGSPADQIIEAAQEWNANLIVVGHRGLSGIASLFMGSVAHKVATYAPCSVLVVKRKPSAVA
jgi:nucleotide-binding universal stress UspA family protein